MVFESQWLAVGAFATLMTLAWLFVQQRLTTTTAFAGIAWSWMALTGGGVTKLGESGTVVEASVGSLQFLCALFAILSFAALMLSRFGHYPPDEETRLTEARNV